MCLMLCKGANTKALCKTKSDFTFSDDVTSCINSISKTRQSVYSAQIKDRNKFHMIQCNLDITEGQGTVKIRSL